MKLYQLQELANRWRDVGPVHQTLQDAQEFEQQRKASGYLFETRIITLRVKHETSISLGC